MRHLKLAFRTLFKTPFVTVVAILSLALGIGANAAIYSMFNELLLQPLPVSHPERLVNLRSPGPQRGSNSCNQAGSCDEVFSYPMFRDLEKANTALSGLAAHVLFGASISMPGRTALSGNGVLVSGSYFPVLGVRPAAGRLLGPDDDRVIGGSYVAVLSYGYWQNQLGGDPSAVGKVITVNGQSMTIVGIAPDGFTGTTLGAKPYVFVPLTMRAQLTPGWKGFERHDSYWVYLFGRLKPGATLEQAQASLNTVYHALINDVEAPLQKGMSDRTLAEFRAKKIFLADGRKGQSSIIKESKTPVLFLFAVTAIVLLIACANIANLLLARAATRTMEMAVRLSLGATRWQLVSQVLTESVLLAVMGGVAGVAFAHWTLAAIVSLLPGQARDLDFTIGAPVLWFTAILSLGTGLLFGLAPALQSTRPDLVTELRNNSGKLSGGRGAARFRTSLVTAQIALSMMLLIAAGLFIKSLRNVSRVDLGINVSNLTNFGIAPALTGYDTAQTKLLYSRVEQALAALPGVTGVTTSEVGLLQGSNWGQGVSVEGFHKGPDTDAGSRFDAGGPGYFHVLGVPLLAGRDFTESDNAGSAKVAIVNEAFAKKFNLGNNAVGKHMSVGNDSLNIEIIGLAKNAKYSQVKDSTPPVFVLPWRQTGRVSSLDFYVRSALPTAPVIQAIRTTMKGIDPNLPVDHLKTVEEEAKENVFLDRMISILSAAFAALATLLAAVGLYGVLAYTITQRTREIGVRMALGADAARVRALVLRQVGAMILVGGIIGVAGAVALGRGAQSLLYELRGYDPYVIALATAGLVLVALLAALVPALRASRIDPIQALRYE